MHPAIPHHLVKPRPSPDSYSVHCSYNAAHGVTASESAHSEPQRTLQNSKGRGTTRAAHAAGPCQSPRQRHGALHTRRISAWLRARTRLRRKISRRLPATAHVVPCCWRKQGTGIKNKSVRCWCCACCWPPAANACSFKHPCTRKAMCGPDITLWQSAFDFQTSLPRGTS